MNIQFFNTISGKKEAFSTLTPGTVKMYCCGITPYSNTHIGHSRTFFSYDLLYRTLLDHNYKVEWARNITDVDDKIIAKANCEGITCADLVSCYVSEQDEMLKLFQLVRPMYEPKVTETITEIIAIIETLIKKEYAYVTNSGVYFRVHRFEQYGKLSGNKVQELRKGVRIDVDETKEDALDFALWKVAKKNEIFWPSPWGNGRPGWHIECSAMIHTLFGDSIDIHMGGRDLIFPHHEAEIAQSEGATGKPLAHTWIHAGMVTLYGEKMSKSTNHYVGIKDFVAKYPPEVLRLVFLSTSYAQPLDFTFEMVTENLKRLAKLYRFVALVDSYMHEVAERSFDEVSAKLVKQTKEFHKDIFAGLEHLSEKMRAEVADDLNSGAALAVFFEFIKNVNTDLSELQKANATIGAQDKQTLQKKWPEFKVWIRKSLGLLLEEPAHFFANLRKYNIGSELSTEQINQKIEERTQARRDKNWAQSDTIRADLLANGVQLQDTPDGTQWTVLI